MEAVSLNQRFAFKIDPSTVILLLVMTTITSLVFSIVHKLRQRMQFNYQRLLTAFKIWIHSWKMTRPGFVESQLEWVRRKTRGERNPGNLTTDWSNGIVLCTLLNYVEPGVCPRYDLLHPDQSYYNLQKAIAILRNHLKHDLFLDVEKVVAGESAPALSYLLSRLKIVSAKRNLRRVLKKPLIQVTDELGRSKPVKLATGECFAKGMGLQLAVVGRRARFNIFFKNASRLNLVVEIIGPNNTKGSQTILEEMTALWNRSNSSRDAATNGSNQIAVTCEIISSQQISVSYVPIQTGKHRLSVLWEDMHISASPFTVQVDSSLDAPSQSSPTDIESPISPLCRFSSSKKIPLKTKILQKTLIEQVLVINGVERPFPTPGFVNLDQIDEQSDSKSDTEAPRSDLEEDISIPEVSNSSSPYFEQDIICNYALTMNYSSYFPDIMDVTNGPASLSNYLDESIDHDAVNMEFERLVNETSFYREEQPKAAIEARISETFLKPPRLAVKEPCIGDRKRTFEDRSKSASRNVLPPKPKATPKLDIVKTSVKDRLKFWESLSAPDEKKPPVFKISRPAKQRKINHVEPPTTTPDSETDSGIVALAKSRDKTQLEIVKERIPVVMRRSGSYPVVSPQSEAHECSMSVSNLQRTNNVSIVNDSRPASGFIDDDYDECVFSGSMATLSESRRSSKDVSNVDSLTGYALRAFGSGLHYATVGLKSNFTVDTQDGSTGYLSVAIQAADPFSVSKISIKTVSRNMFHISYLATLPGYIRIHVRWSDKDIPGSPFECRVAERH